MNIRSVSVSALMISIASLSGVGCGSTETASTGVDSATHAETQGTVLATVVMPNGHTFEFVELKAGDVLVSESLPSSDARTLGEETQSMSLADVYRMLSPGEIVPAAILSADARVEEVRKNFVAGPHGTAPEGPAADPIHRVNTEDGFYTQFCAGTDNINCWEGRTGTLTGTWVYNVWFQTAGMVNGASPAGTNATLNLNEWVNGAEKTVFSHTIAPGNYWYLTRWTLPPTYHRGILVANNAATMTSFSEQSENLLVNVSLDNQLESNWCWAATGEMVMAYFGVSVSQCSEANQLFNLTYCCIEPYYTACNQGGNPPFSQHGFTYKYTPWGTALPFATIVSEIQAGRPVTHQIEWPTHSHFVVVVGAYVNNGNDYVVVNDPEGSVTTELYSAYVSGTSGGGYTTGADQYAFQAP